MVVSVAALLIFENANAFVSHSHASLQINSKFLVKNNFVPTSNQSPHQLNKPITTKLQMAIEGPIRYSTKDWWECLMTLPHSLILKRIKSNLVFLTLWTTLLTWVFKVRSVRFIFPATVHSTVGALLSLLLAFRTNASYDRYWEGRKSWATIIGLSRDFARITKLHIKSSYHEYIAKLLVAFGTCLKQHLQGTKNNDELESIFGDIALVEDIQAHKHRPLYILTLLSKTIHNAIHHPGHDISDLGDLHNPVVNTLHEHQFEDYIHGLGSAMAACERIVKQPVPLSYSRHTSRFLTFFLASLPLILIPSLGWITVPTMTAIAWAVLSVQEISHYIENPFAKGTQDIPLQPMIAGMRAEISEVLS